MSTPSLASMYDVESINLLGAFGTERLKKVLADHPEVSPYDRVDLVMKEIKAWSDASLRESSGYDSSLLDSSDDDSEDEDEAGGEIVKLGDERKPGTVKRPQAPIESELECKKPRAESSASQGEEPESEGTEDSSQ